MTDRRYFLRAEEFCDQDWQAGFRAGMLVGLLIVLVVIFAERAAFWLGLI